MKKKFVMQALMLVLGILLFSATPAFAESRGRGEGRMGPGGEILKTLIQLDISDAQKHDIAVVLKKYQGEMKQEGEKMQAARKALFKAIHSDTFNEGEVRIAAKTVGQAEEDLAVLRAKLVSEIRPILTPEQVTLLRDKKKQFQGSLKGRMNSFRSMADAWINSHAGE